MKTEEPILSFFFSTNRVKEMNLLDVDPDDIYRYGSQGIDDHGWGCVYRNIQTIRKMSGMPVPSIEDIQRVSGIDPALSGKNLWIEPKQAMPFLPGYNTLNLYRTVQDVSPYLLRTSISDFNHVFKTPAETESFLLETLKKNKRILLDDSIQSYILTGIVDDTFVYIDPHVSKNNVRSMSRAEFFRRPLWMMLS